MDYIKSNRTLSLLGQRGTFGTVLHNLALDDKRIIALSSDLTNPSGLDRFLRDIPDRLINVGIAEQNSIGVAAGLADNGFIPFVTTFANFATLRSNEFVRHFMAYMNCNIKLIGLGSGFALEFFGNTHYGVEDIAVLRSMPNITILSPSDCLEVVKCVEFCMEYSGPVYLRLTGKSGNPIINKEDYDFTVGKGIILREGEATIIYATGSMVSVALKVATELDAQGKKIKVVNIHTIKPIDRDLIIQNKDYKLIVTIEEHAKIGGLGSAISEILVEQDSHGKMMKFGTEDFYPKAGQYEYMLEQHGLTVKNISNKIINEI